jgi:hypothetical protein
MPADFPDAEAIAAKQIRLITQGKVYSTVPKKSPLPLPFTVVRRLGGAPKMKEWVDAPRIQVEGWGRNRTEARVTAQAARVALIELEGGTTPEAVITEVKDDTGLFPFADPDSGTDRFIFGVQMTLHPR